MCPLVNRGAVVGSTGQILTAFAKKKRKTNSVSSFSHCPPNIFLFLLHLAPRPPQALPVLSTTIECPASGSSRLSALVEHHKGMSNVTSLEYSNILKNIIFTILFYS